MKLFNRFSDSAVRVFYILIALYCLSLNLFTSYNTLIKRVSTDDCLWIDKKDSNGTVKGLQISQIITGGVADEAGIKDNDLLVAINGEKFKNGVDAMILLNKYNNEYIDYTIIRSGETQVVKIRIHKFFNVLYFIFWLMAIGFLFVGFLVGYSRPKEFSSKLFFALGCSGSVGLLMYAGANSFGIDPMKSIFIFYNYIALLLLFHPLLIHFFLTYPVNYDFRNRKKFLVFIYTFILVFYLFQSFLIKFLFGNYLSYPYNDVLGFSVPVAYVVTALIFFKKSYDKITDDVLKKPMNIIRRGLLLGAAGLSYYVIFSILINKPIFLIKPVLLFPIILVLGIPLSFGYSIFKYRILDTEFIVKRGLIFGIIALFIAGFYLLLVFIVDRFLSEYFAENRQIVTIAFIVFVTFTFDFVNKRAKGFVDKQFYRESYNYRKSLLQFSQELSFLNNFNDIVEKISRSVGDTMGIRKIKIWIESPEFYNTVFKTEFTRSASQEASMNDIIIGKGDPLFNLVYKLVENREPLQLSEFNISLCCIDDNEKTIIKNSSLSLVIPMFYKNVLIGAMLFGQKPSGKAYSDEDIDLLKTFASQSSIALENSRLQKEQIEKQKIEEELMFAKKIQMGLLPQSDFAFKGLEISGIMIPAKTIGGDFYDLIKVTEDKILLVVADVSGKGVPAALYMSKVQAMIQFAAKLFHSPKEILMEVNKQIYHQIERKFFITMIVAMFDLKEKNVRISRAGHNPVVYSLNGSIGFLKNKGIGLGLEKDTIFNTNLEETILDIDSNNLFVFYSDGITEAMNRKREEYGNDRLIDIVNRNRDVNPENMREVILDSLTEFRDNAEQNDDITFVVVKVK